MLKLIDFISTCPLVQVCGPPGMMEHISGGKAKDWSQGEVRKTSCCFNGECLTISLFFLLCSLISSLFALLQLSGILKELGYTEEMVYKF